MRVRSNILMIGAATRNVGKTEFACRVIRRWRDTVPVVGLKVTTIKEPHGGCARGGAGCGACSSLAGDFEILEETRKTGRKDTQRMLAAGASRVFWLRVRREHLAQGLGALLKSIPRGVAAVCESNSLRTVLAPGVFVVIRQEESFRSKASCTRVLPLADQLVTFDGADWDFQPEQVVFAQNRWLLRQNAAAIILAGGRSRRMGQDKSLMALRGKPMIQHIAEQLRPVFAELIVGANDAAKYGFLNARVVSDAEPDLGPLMGIASCLAASRHELNFVTGCDIPTMNLDFILRMLATAKGCDIVMPRWPDGRPEPLFAVYRKSVAATARAILAHGGRRIVELLDGCRVRFLDLPDTGWYHNLNTAEDYARATAPDATEPQ